eukprot:GILJ01007651.1.p1 GENE.GILJ01007651.1~~GILJ01007651.1.p1  ORF type:complete len:222 (+),score=15.98 GILJ01007651.1:50-667(+)
MSTAGFPPYSDSAYWDQRYAIEPDSTFEWLQPFHTFRNVLLPHFPQSKELEILVIGCGNSSLSSDLYYEGYHNVTSIDTSAIVIDQMSERMREREEMEFTVMDACQMSYPAACFDIIIDKATMDTMLCGDESFARVSGMVKEAYRTLKDHGSYFVISHGVPETRLGYLRGKSMQWDVTIHKIPKSCTWSPEESSSSHYIYVCNKT